MGHSGFFHENPPELKRDYEAKSGVPVLHVLGGIIICVSSLSFCHCHDVIYIYFIYISFRSIVVRGNIYVRSGAFFSLYIGHICSLISSSAFLSFYHLLVNSFLFRALIYIYLFLETIKQLRNTTVNTSLWLTTGYWSTTLTHVSEECFAQFLPWRLLLSCT
jgi:hypothetical protein